MSMLKENRINRRTLIGATGVAGASALAAPAILRSRRAGAQDAQQVKALMWSNSPTIDANFEKRVEMFNEAHAGQYQVTLEFLPYDQYWQKLLLSYSSGDPYDVYFWDVQAYGHYKRDLLLNVQPMVDAAGLFDPAEYPTELFEPWRFEGGNLYAIPENLQTIALYYNKSIFDEAGAAVPDDTWSWDQVLEAARNLTIRDGDRVRRWGLNLGVLDVWWGMQTLSWAQGDAFFDQTVEPTKFQFSNPTNIETMRWVQDLIWTEELVPEPAVMAQDFETIGFNSGNAAMIVSGSWDISGRRELPFEWGLAPLPKFGDNRVVPYWMGGWVIANASQVQEGAFEWARWSATDFQPTMAADGDWIPIQNAARESEDFIAQMPDGFASVSQSLTDARLGDFYSANNQQIWNEVFTPNLTQLLNNEQSPEDTAARIDEAANALLVSE